MRRLLIAVASRCRAQGLQWLWHRLRSCGAWLRRYPVACGIFPDQGSNLYPFIGRLILTRGTTGLSGSLSCGARDTVSPFWSPSIPLVNSTPIAGNRSYPTALSQWDFYPLLMRNRKRDKCFRMDWLDLLAVQGTFKNFLQHNSSKASILWRSAFFTHVICSFLSPAQTSLS